jgi:hypothetical protein
VFLWLNLLWKVKLCRDLRERGWLFVAGKKNAQERIRNWGRGEEGRTSNHKLNITDGLTDKIILMVTQLAILSIKMSCHHTIYLLESHCNTLHNVAGIY